MNQLKVNQQHTIIALREQGWCKRRIARELALDRATVRKYLAASTAKPARRLTGSADVDGPKTPTPQPLGRVHGGKITHPPANRLGDLFWSGQFV